MIDRLHEGAVLLAQDLEAMFWIAAASGSLAFWLGYNLFVGRSPL